MTSFTSQSHGFLILSCINSLKCWIFKNLSPFTWLQLSLTYWSWISQTTSPILFSILLHSSSTTPIHLWISQETCGLTLTTNRLIGYMQNVGHPTNSSSWYSKLYLFHQLPLPDWILPPPNPISLFLRLPSAQPNLGLLNFLHKSFKTVPCSASSQVLLYSTFKSAFKVHSMIQFRQPPQSLNHPSGDF